MTNSHERAAVAADPPARQGHDAAVHGRVTLAVVLRRRRVFMRTGCRAGGGGPWWRKYLALLLLRGLCPIRRLFRECVYTRDDVEYF